MSILLKIEYIIFLFYSNSSKKMGKDGYIMCNNLDEVESKMTATESYVICIDYDKIQSKITKIAVEIKNSTIPTAGHGTFALQSIPKGTYFIPITNEPFSEFYLKTNDLAYNGNIDEYDYLLSIKTNVAYVRNIISLFNKPKILCYYAIKDINVGDELSRVYGIDYWKDVCFWNKHSDSKWRQTKLDVDLPNDWVHIDDATYQLWDSGSTKLYAKKEDNKFYYMVGELDRTDECFRELPIYAPIKSGGGYDMYRKSYIQSIDQIDPHVVPIVPMNRPYHDTITCCINNDIDGLKKQDISNMISKNNYELYYIATCLSCYEIIRYLTEFVDKIVVIKNLCNIMVKNELDDSLKSFEYVYNKFKLCLSDEVINELLSSIQYYKISLNKLKWIIQTFPQFKITAEFIENNGEFHDGYHSYPITDKIQYLYDNPSLLTNDEVLIEMFIQYCYKYNTNNARQIYEKVQDKQKIDKILTYDQFHGFIGYGDRTTSIDQRLELVDYLLHIKPQIDIKNEQMFRYLNQRHIGNDISVELYCRKIPEYRLLDCYVSKPN